MARQTIELSSMKSKMFLRAGLDRANQIERACEFRFCAQVILPTLAAACEATFRKIAH